MCGFAGFIVRSAPLSWNPIDVLGRMGDTLAHRGPDDEGTWSDSDRGVFLAFRRLSIIDLSEAGHQPMVSASGRYVVVFNGEVYNAETLRRALDRPSGSYRGHSDTEVLLACFEAHGVEKALKEFRGMFALAVWDRERHELWLARDRMGIKPLYVFDHGSGVAFASEVRAFHDYPPCPGRGDLQAAASFLRRLYVPAPMSILEGVEKIPPGGFRVYRFVGGVPRERDRGAFCRLTDHVGGGSAAGRRTPEEVVDELHEHLLESVRLRLVADVPVGALLSGGIDSTVVTGIMQELSPEPVRTFTIRFDDLDYDEAPAARAVSEALGTRHTEVGFSMQEAAELLPSLAALSDEPMANPSLLPTVLVSRVARRDVVVALSGDGGDELFGGYNRYRHGEQLIKRAGQIPGGLRAVTAAGVDGLSGVADSTLVHRILRALSVTAQHSPRERMRKVFRVLEAKSPLMAYRALLNVGFENPPLLGIESRPIGDDLHPFDTPGLTLLQRMMLTDQLDYLPDDLLTKVDRASMWESLEARVPLLDRAIVEFSWGLPDDMKIRHGVTKWPLRRIAERYLPPELIDRPKMGFTVPIARWLRGPLREWARDTLSAGTAGYAVPWDRRVLDRQLNAFERGRDDLALQVWTAAVFQSWADAWKVGF